MHKVINCFKEDNPVIQKKLKEVTLDEGLYIAKDLLNVLAKRKEGIGLAANQIGIDAAVAVVNVREPIILINPEIISKNTEIPYYEGCLSFPGKGYHTKRYETVEVTSENVEGSMIFSGVDSSENDKELRTLEVVCVQHEIDHLNGMRILDREVDTTIRVGKKIGRNEKVLIACGVESKVMKYKKAIPLLENGWVLVE